MFFSGMAVFISTSKTQTKTNLSSIRSDLERLIIKASNLVKQQNGATIVAYSGVDQSGHEVYIFAFLSSLATGNISTFYSWLPLRAAELSTKKTDLIWLTCIKL